MPNLAYFYNQNKLQIKCPNRRKWDFRRSSFQNFPGEDAPDPSTELAPSALVCSAPPTFNLFLHLCNLTNISHFRNTKYKLGVAFHQLLLEFKCSIFRCSVSDTSVSYASDSLDEIQNVINSELKNLNSWLIANRLSLNITKTEFMIIGSRQRMNATQNDIAIRIRDREINRADVVKSLGMHIDRHLSWSEHIHKISKKISFAIGALKRARPFISCKTAVQVYTALIQPHFDYCCSVWDELRQNYKSYKTEPLGSLRGLVMMLMLTLY